MTASQTKDSKEYLVAQIINKYLLQKLQADSQLVLNEKPFSNGQKRVGVNSRQFLDIYMRKALKLIFHFSWLGGKSTV